MRRLVLTLMMCGAMVWSQQSALEKVAAAAREKSVAAAVSAHPGLNAEEMRKFLAEHSPELLEEWERRCREQSDDAPAYFELLAKHYLELTDLQKSNPQEYARRIRQQRTESEVRRLSRRIQELAASPKKDSPELKELKMRLRRLMEEYFDESQARQQIEINRLENELLALKKLAEDRAVNKYIILSQRFWLLTGQEWPDGE